MMLIHLTLVRMVGQTNQINPDMTNALIAESLDWSVSKVKYYVQKLKRANKIKRAGTSRKGYWEVFEEEDN